MYFICSFQVYGMGTLFRFVDCAAHLRAADFLSINLRDDALPSARFPFCVPFVSCLFPTSFFKRYYFQPHSGQHPAKINFLFENPTLLIRNVKKIHINALIPFSFPCRKIKKTRLRQAVPPAGDASVPRAIPSYYSPPDTHLTAGLPSPLFVVAARAMGYG